MSDARGAAVKPVVAAIDPSISGAAVWVGRDLVDRRGGVFEAGNSPGTVTTGATRYYWLKAVDSSGNASAFSSGVSATAL